MADEANNTQTETKQQTVAEGMDSRRIFPNVNEATQYLMASAGRFSDFADIPVAMPGIVKDENGDPLVNEDGSPQTDPEMYNDSVDVMVALLKKQGAGVKAIVAAPVPKISALLESESGRAWAEKILHKEINHVAVRHLRDAEDPLSFVDQIPTTLEGYITSERASGGIMETFDALYKGIDDVLKGKIPAWAKRRFIKSELKKALESKGYAQEFYADLEDYKGRSLFESALDLGINAAKRKGLDPTIFERWKSTRNAKTYNPAEDEDEDELDLDSLATQLIADEGEAAPAGESTEDVEATDEAETPADTEATA